MLSFSICTHQATVTTTDTRNEPFFEAPGGSRSSVQSQHVEEDIGYYSILCYSWNVTRLRDHRRPLPLPKSPTANSMPQLKVVSSPRMRYIPPQSTDLSLLLHDSLSALINLYLSVF